MRKTLLTSSFLVTLGVACSGEVLDVGEETASSGGTTGNGDGDSSSSSSSLPCDIFEGAGHPCVAAHSTVRRLRRDYEGPLYQLCKSAVPGPGSCQGQSAEIGATSVGFADVAAHEGFCEADCKITIIYDQSGRGSHLEPPPSGSAKSTPGEPADAWRLPVTVDGHEAYGVKLIPNQGYRAGCNECTRPSNSGMPVHDEPQTIYMVTSSQDTINGCCFNYGNAEVTANNDGNGTMEALNVSGGVIWGTGVGPGPWVMADLENGLFPGWENGGYNNISTNTSVEHEFVTAALVGDTADKNHGKGRFALYGGNAQAGELSTKYDGIRPERPGYVPMMKQGSIILGIGGDNSNGGGGRFYEGAIVTGAATTATLDEVQAAIVAAKYGE